jgi:hypothetical protein
MDMNTRKAASVIIIGSLAVLMSGCAGVAAPCGQVQDYLGPAANAAELGLARGHVIVRDDLSPTRVENRRTAESAPRAVEQGPSAWTADARREFHAQPPVQSVTVERPFSAEVWRELKGSAPSVTVEQPFSAEVWRELKGIAPATVAQPFSDAAKRELKGSAPVGVSAADMQGRRLSAYAEAQAAANPTAAEMQGNRLSAYAEARTDAAIRELKGGAPTGVVDSYSRLHGWTLPSERPFSAEAIRELKGSAPVDVNDYLSPLGD